MNVSKPRTLLVEDDYQAMLRMHRFLELWAEHQVVVATNLAGALSFLEVDAFNFIVMDLTLPDGDGIEIIRAVRARNLKTKIAVCTGVVDPERLAEVKAAGPDKLYTKPFEIDRLIKFLAYRAEPNGTDDHPTLKG